MRHIRNAPEPAQICFSFYMVNGIIYKPGLNGNPFRRTKA